MAKKLVYNYTFDASAQTIKISGLYTLRTLILITNVTDQQIIYNFADSSAGGTVSYSAQNDETTITLEYNTASMSDSDELQILADDGQDLKIDAGDSLVDPVHKFRVSTPENLIDTDFEYGLQPTKWETIELVDNIPSVYVRGSGISIGGIVSLVTIQNSEIISVTTNIAHDLATGDPIEVQGTNSRTANGKYVVTSITSDTEFRYKASNVQSTSTDIKTAYTTIIPGSFFEGSEINFDLNDGIITDDASSSTLTVITDYIHGLSSGTSLYISNTVSSKELVMSNQPLDTAPDNGNSDTIGSYVDIYYDTIYLAEHNLVTGTAITIEPDRVTNPSARLPNTPAGVLQPTTSSQACSYAYDSGRDACESIITTIKASNGHATFYMNGGSTQSAYYNSGYNTEFVGGDGTTYKRQYMVYSEYLRSSSAYHQLRVYTTTGALGATYRWYSYQEGVDRLYTGQPFNLGIYFSRYSGSGSSNLAGHIFYQSTPYVNNAFTDFIYTVQTFDAPNNAVASDSLRYYYDRAGGGSARRQHFGWTGGPYSRNAIINHGDGWYYMRSMQINHPQNNFWGSITVDITLWNTSFDQEYQTPAGFHYSNTHPDFYPGWMGQCILLTFHTNHGMNTSQINVTTGSVISGAQIASSLVTAVANRLTFATFSNPTGVNTVEAVFYNGNRIQLRDSQKRIFDFNGVSNGTSPYIIKTVGSVIGGQDDYYAITGIGSTAIEMSTPIRVAPRVLEFASAGILYHTDEEYHIGFDSNIDHTLSSGQKVVFNVLTGTAPGGLVDGTTYWAITDDNKYLRLADSPENADANVNAITGAGSGTFNLQVYSISGKVAGIGTVTISESSENVTGTNTKFRSTYKVGDQFSVASIGSTINEFRDSTIVSIVSDTSLTLDNTPGIGVTGVPHYTQTKVNVRADGEFVHRPFDGGVEISAGRSPDSSVVRQTRKYFRYQSGKGIQCSMAINYNPARPVRLASGSGTTVVMTTEYPHGLTSSNSIKVSGASDSVYNGTYTITSSTDFTFTYTASGTVTEANPTGFIEYSINGYSNAGIRAGLFDFQNGFFFEYDGSDLYAVRRSSVQQLSGTCNVNKGSNIIVGTNTRFQDQLSAGDMIVIRGQSHKVTSVVSQDETHIQPYYRGTSASGAIATKTIDLKISQSNWNIDKADGTGPSGYILDINKIQMVYLDYSWYGAGKIRFGFKDTYGHVKYMHEFIHNNRLNEAYMRSGNVPARYEAFNSGGTPTFVPSLFHWGTSVIMDGGFDNDDSYLFTASGNQLTFTNGDTSSATTNLPSVLTSVGKRYKNYYVKLSFPSSAASQFTTGIPLYTADGALNGQAVEFTQYSSGGIDVYIYISSGYFAPAIYPSVASGVAVSIGAPSTGAAGTVDLTSLIPLISIRLAPSVDNNIIGALGERDIINRMQLKLQELGISVTHDTEITVLLNASVNNLNYLNVGTPSLSQYVAHLQGDTVEDGTVIYRFRASGGNKDSVTGKYITSSSAFDLSQLIDLGNSILGGDGVFPNGPDIITICATVINTSEIDSTVSYQVSSRLSWSESQA
jgi:hypothetical protein